jgi:hypothetical protein
MRNKSFVEKLAIIIIVSIFILMGLSIIVSPFVGEVEYDDDRWEELYEREDD